MKESQFVSQAWERGVRITDTMVGNYFLFYAENNHRRHYFDNDLDVPDGITAEQILKRIQAENAARTKPGVPRKEVTCC
jgi:hypothetical protein